MSVVHILPLTPLCILRLSHQNNCSITRFLEQHGFCDRISLSYVNISQCLL